MWNVRSAFAYLALAFFMGSASKAALVVDDYSAARHERFANDPAQFVGSAAVAGFDLDFSGVARAANGFWVTMISPTHFVSAAHAPAAGAVAFHHDNDPAGGTTARTVGGGARVGSTDIWVGWLTAAIDPALVAIYDVAPAGDIVGSEVYQVGRGTQLGADNTTGFRVGRNVASALYEDVMLSPGVHTDSLVYFDDSVEGDLAAPLEQGPEHVDPTNDRDETFFQPGDSGGPSFLVDGIGTLLLTGMHSFITEPDPEFPDSPFNDRRASGDAALAAYRQQIYAAIPEAPPLLLMAMGLVAAVAARRTRGSAPSGRRPDRPRRHSRRR